MYVSFSAIDSHTANISWSPPLPDQQNGIIQYYNVTVQNFDISQYFYYHTTNLALTLTDLHPYYTYTATLAAVTIATGPFSNGKSITTFEDGNIIHLINYLYILYSSIWVTSKSICCCSKFNKYQYKLGTYFTA